MKAVKELIITELKKKRNRLQERLLRAKALTNCRTRKVRQAN